IDSSIWKAFAVAGCHKAPDFFHEVEIFFPSQPTLPENLPVRAGPTGGEGFRSGSQDDWSPSSLGALGSERNGHSSKWKCAEGASPAMASRDVSKIADTRADRARQPSKVVRNRLPARLLKTHGANSLAKSRYKNRAKSFQKHQGRETISKRPHKTGHAKRTRCHQ